MKSPRTTWAGIVALLGAVATAVAAMLDSDPSTVADWGIVAGLAAAGFAAIFARDETPNPPTA